MQIALYIFGRDDIEPSAKDKIVVPIPTESSNTIVCNFFITKNIELSFNILDEHKESIIKSENLESICAKIVKSVQEKLQDLSHENIAKICLVSTNTVQTIIKTNLISKLEQEFEGSKVENKSFKNVTDATYPGSKIDLQNFIPQYRDCVISASDLQR